ncbi:adenosylcobinamide-GDP ribazoletransferase [Chitinispirillales bacterium ANBcel5]|uniref:adenosylcobinamide-GDP ribazoletransferase n=1 Tax=Cellulosispirillum alkaliphilum TaxID=3039283 RepID=UPI002A5436AA|nr:adenosylcobinamide-GDP ribazoletransferase [Chitinispirillales bacterium ANBcel5]
MIPKGFITALRLLTIIPVIGKEAEKRYCAIPYFLIVGLIISIIHFLGAEILYHYLPGLTVFAGLLLTIINYTASGALHLDGLADTADAFSTVQTREKTLFILKDPHLGTFGAGAMFIVILWRIITYQQLFEQRMMLWVVFALMFSRIMQGLFLLLIPYARGKEGKAFGFKGPFAFTAILIMQSVLLFAAGWLIFDYRIVLSVVIGIASILPICLVYHKRIGGITGDGIGAATEVFEIVFLTVVVAFV